MLLKYTLIDVGFYQNIVLNLAINHVSSIKHIKAAHAILKVFDKTVTERMTKLLMLFTCSSQLDV